MNHDPMAIRRAVLALHERRKRRARAHRPAFTVNLTPMIDMSFILLIFFVATTTFDRPEGVLASKLPHDSTERIGAALPISPIVIRILEGPTPEEFFLRTEPVSKTAATFSDLTILLREIQQLPGFDAQTPVVLIAEDGVRWDHVVNGWNAAVRAGCKNLVFGQPKP